MAASPSGAELCVPSVISPGFERWFPGTAPETIAATLVAANPELVFAETSRRGYGSVTLALDRARLDWHVTRPEGLGSTRLAAQRTGWVKPGHPVLQISASQSVFRVV